MTENPSKLGSYRFSIAAIVAGAIVGIFGYAFGGFTSEMAAGFIGAGVAISAQGVVSLLITVGESVFVSQRSRGKTD